MSSISQPSMPRSLFKQLYCEMFAFSAFGQGPHTEYYFILQGDGGGRGQGLWKRLHFERLLFLITAWLLKWIKSCNLAHTHSSHIEQLILKLCANLKPLLNVRVIYRHKMTVFIPKWEHLYNAAAWGLLFGVCVCVLEFNGIWCGDWLFTLVKLTRS